MGRRSPLRLQNTEAEVFDCGFGLFPDCRQFTFLIIDGALSSPSIEKT